MSQRQVPGKGQFSLSLLLLVTKLMALGIASTPAIASPVPAARASEGQTHLEVTPEGTLSASELVEPIPTTHADGHQPQVAIVQTLDGTLIAQAQDETPEEELSEETNLEDLESDY